MLNRDERLDYSLLGYLVDVVRYLRIIQASERLETEEAEKVGNCLNTVSKLKRRVSESLLSY